jgi:hypothetical protein
MPTDMTARQLIKQIPPVLATLNYEGTDEIVINSDYGTSGWEVITPSSGNVLYLVWRGYIDLAGYTQDDLTFFAQAVDLQHGCLDIGSPSILQTINLDLVTTRRMTNDECDLQAGFLTLGGTASGAGIDIQEVIWGQWRSQVPYSATYGTLRQIAGDTFGTGNPTASSRIHLTRIYNMQTTGDGHAIQIAGANYVIGGVTAHEKDLVYIERLRRAYTQERS